jgi:hypothetical protein
MALGKVCEPFVAQRPIWVMARGVLEHLGHAERIDALCARTAQVQYPRAVVFSAGVALMGQGVLGVHPSVPAAYQAQADQLGVSDQAIFDTLHHVAGGVSAERGRDAARQAAPVIGALHAERPPRVPGDRTKMLDGHHLAASEQRVAERRRTWAAPLPGQILVGLEPQPMLAPEVVVCEDGHAQERSLLGQVLPLVSPDDLWMAERHFGTIDFLWGMAARGGSFVLRQHGQLQGTLVGSRTYQGAVDTGKVYEQRIDLGNAPGDTMPRRRLTVAWHEPTRDGAAAIHLLRNVPRRHASAQTLAASYRQRWTLETMWQAWTETWTCEVHA